MRYFDLEYISFFKELAANNHTQWFADNRKRYEKHVKEPTQVLVGDLLQELSKTNAQFGEILPKDCIFRINRDIRFAKDKSPYKNFVSVLISPYGRKNASYPGLYFQLDVDQTMVAGGAYMPQKEELLNIRNYIAAHPDEIKKALENKAFASTFGGLAPSEKNKILPPHLKEAAALEPLIFNKQFYFEAHHPGETFIVQDNLKEELLAHYDAGEAWNAVLRKAMRL